MILGFSVTSSMKIAEADLHSQISEVVEPFRDAAKRDLFDRAFSDFRPQPAEQLDVVLESIVGRIGSDFTPPHFSRATGNFMQGIEWTSESSMDDIGRRYAYVFSQHYSPFMSRHEYMLEHYLVSYVHRTLFHSGRRRSTTAARAAWISALGYGARRRQPVRPAGPARWQ